MDTQKIKIYKDGEIACMPPDAEPGRNVFIALVRKGKLNYRFGGQSLVYGKGLVTMLNLFPGDGIETGEDFSGYVLSLPAGMLYDTGAPGMLNDRASQMDGISLSDAEVRTLNRYLTLIRNSSGNADSPLAAKETDCLCRAFLAKCNKYRSK